MISAPCLLVPPPPLLLLSNSAPKVPQTTMSDGFTFRDHFPVAHDSEITNVPELTLALPLPAHATVSTILGPSNIGTDGTETPDLVAVPSSGTMSTSQSSSSSSTSPGTSDQPPAALSRPATIGIGVFAGVVVAAIMAVLVWGIIQVNRKRKKLDEQERDENTERVISWRKRPKKKKKRKGVEKERRDNVNEDGEFSDVSL
ncbi:hypothetical protein F4778DRAFT_94364 [Xylariomycetidae sp. FL2044]|nr:hypothetical protein F4778DRAFT_94364 [Xylariomycetidae sp. FL2044]